MASQTQTNQYGQFFENLALPDSFHDEQDQMKRFVECHRSRKNRIVLITSGGTTVPLESRTVRFIDNFSIGTRGATSTEYFLRKGYAVIFLHRLRSLQPFSHRVNKNLLDALSVSVSDSDPVVTVAPSHVAQLAPIVQEYQLFRSQGMLLMIDFTTLSEYLWLLRAAAECLNCCGKEAMIYLAAAVSDFYIPKNEMPEHKIQSSDGALQLSLQMTPKMLKPLVKEWAPSAFVVSFKLETDPSILISKARKALHTYQHQMVVANILETRKREVHIVTLETDEFIKLSDEDLAAQKEIEELLIKKLLEHHSDFINK